MSKNRSYLEQIDEEIAHHRAELEKLLVARQVIARLAGAAAEAPEAPASGITIRRVETPAPKAKVEKPVKAQPAARSPERKAEKAAIREKVLEELQAEPQTSTALIAKLLPGGPGASKNEKQTVYDALYNLKLNGVLDRTDDALYRIVGEVPQQATSH